MTYTLNLSPVLHGYQPVLSLSGDQIEAQIWNCQTGEIRHFRPPFQGRRPWLALEFGEFLKAHPDALRNFGDSDGPLGCSD